MKQIWYCFLLSMLVVSCGKKAPTDDQLKDLCRNAGFAIEKLTDEQAQEEAFMKLAKESEATYDIEQITPEQIDLLFTNGGIALEKPLRNWLSPVLKKKAENNGTVFAYYYWKFLPGNNGIVHSDDEVEAYKTLVCKEDVAQFIEQNPDAGADILNGAAGIKGEKWAQCGIIPQVKALLTYPLSDNAIEQAVKVFNTAFVSEIPVADKEEIRLQALKLYQTLAGRTDSPSQKERAESQIQYLQGAFATGTLIGNKAPQLHFLWISNGNEKTLDDLKGKVVMLDFWATKCAPCIGSFPEMAELQKHYQNSPVVILGVTSIMGYFVDRPNKRTVNTENNPEKEMALMPAYMKGMGITWRIAFTEEDVMNVEYGALAIPHVTLIDKEGKVRYNNVTESNEEKIKLIDSLLKE